MISRSLRSPLFAATLLAVVGPAMAQPASPSTQPSAPGCSGTQLQPGEAQDPKLRDGGGNLSDKLAQSGGVICPPTAVDPDIKAPTPSTGDRSVVPPPGSPGGDPTVQPK